MVFNSNFKKDKILNQQNLEDHFTSLYEDHAELWNYYKREFDGDLHTNLENPANLIKTYLGFGNKEVPELDNYFNDPTFKDRLQHTLSVFFIGILLYNQVHVLKYEIDDFLSRLNKTLQEKDHLQKHEIPFCYYWFLVCFFHDLGYFIAKKRDNEFQLFGKKSWSQVESKVIQTLYKILPLGEEVAGFTKTSCFNYLNFRKGQEGNIDHGILAGTYFYYVREEQYWKKKNLISPSADSFIDKATGLHWSIHLLEIVHSSVAWNIIAHNMWFKKCTELDSINYSLNGLRDLILFKGPLVNLRDYPFYFLLCLIDTIDPVKFCWKQKIVDITSIIQNIEISTKDDSFTIQFRNELNKVTDIYYNHLINSMDWLGLAVVKDDSSGITISFI